ncbi:MAG TPA: hypothetical protein ACFCUD_12855 [Cyclobacteriaceae bacterium]
MIRLFILSILFFSLNICFGQFPSQIFHEGWLVTNHSDTIRGELKYNMQSESVQLKTDGRILTFSSRKLIYFEIFDETVSNYRQFYSLPYNVNYNYKTPLIFEVLYEGELTLLSKEEIVEEVVQQFQPYSTLPAGTRQALSYTFYFLDKKGNIQRYGGRKKDLYEIMRKERNNVKEFIKSNKLKTDNIRDLVRITAYYNSLI